jgi:acetyl esterase
MKKLLLIILATAVTSSLVAEETSNVDAPGGKIYTYKKDNGVAREIEIHFPKSHDASEKLVPGIIMFHGGGWGGGDRKQFRYLCQYFASRGVVAATVGYELAKKAKKGEGSRKRVCIRDAKSAIRWYKQHANELGIDPKCIIAGGGSAGGHVSLLATTNPDLNCLDDSKDYDTSVAAYLLFNPALSASDAKDSEVDFLHHLKADLSPAIVFFGTKDKWLKGWNPAYKKMKSLGIKTVEFWVAKDQGHSFFNQQPWTDITITASDRFLNKLGFIEGEPTLVVSKKEARLIKKP